MDIIIAAKNEGDVLKGTVQNIRETQDMPVNIIIVNDGSNDGYDYDAIATLFDCKIIHNEKSNGVGGARHQGVALAESGTILIIDGHMRFPHYDWVNRITNHVKENPRSVMCCTCKYLTLDSLDMKEPGGYRGANIALDTGPNARWLPKIDFKNQVVAEIPTVMGASYCMSKKWYDYIGGLKYLSAWGQDEQLLSWKSWRLGGDCKLILDVSIGHIWNTRPSGITFETPELHKNQYVTALLGLPEPFRTYVISAVRAKDANGVGWKLLDPSIYEEVNRIDSFDYYNENFTRLIECNLFLTGKAPSHPAFTINKEKKLVSVIIPVTDAGNLERAVNSFDMQTYPNKELIIVNGTDSEIKLDSYHPNIIIQKMAKPINKIDSLINVGALLSSGEVLTVLYPQDYFLPNYLDMGMHYSNKDITVFQGYISHYQNGKAFCKFDVSQRSVFIKSKAFTPDYKEKAEVLALGHNSYCITTDIKNYSGLIRVRNPEIRSRIFKDLEDLKWV